MFFELDPSTSSETIQHFSKSIRIPPDLAATAFKSIAGSIFTLLAAKTASLITERGRRKERVRLVAEAAEVLRLRKLLEDLPPIAGWKPAESLVLRLEAFALDNLARVEKGLYISAKNRLAPGPRRLVTRIFVAYPPHKRWLWLFHGLYFAFLIGAVATTIGIFLDKTNNFKVAMIQTFFVPGLLLVSGAAANLAANYFDLRTYFLASLTQLAVNPGNEKTAPAHFAGRKKIRTLFLIYRPKTPVLAFVHLAFYASTPFAFFGALILAWAISTGITSWYGIETTFLIFAFTVFPTILWSLIANLGDALVQVDKVDTSQGSPITVPQASANELAAD